jgi:hypothetical protein
MDFRAMTYKNYYDKGFAAGRAQGLLEVESREKAARKKVLGEVEEAIRELPEPGTLRKTKRESDLMLAAFKLDKFNAKIAAMKEKP